MNMRYTGNRGLTLIVLIGSILVMSLFAAGLLVFLSTGLLETVGTSDASEAFSAAESGMSVARAQMFTNIFWFTNLPCTVTGSIGRATFSAKVDSTNIPIITITSTGRKNDLERTSVWKGTGMVMRAMVVYREDLMVEPRYQVYTNFKLLMGETNAQSADTNPQWMRVVSNPLSNLLTNEFLLVAQNSTRWIWAQTYSNGVWFDRTLLNGSGQVPNAASRSYDVAYENLSGRGMVVYSTNGVYPQYRIWNGANWSTQTAITNLDATGPIRWVRLIPKRGSNEIMLMARWQTTPPTRNHSSAIIWNGSTWTNLQPLEVNCKSEIDYETMDAAFMANSAIAVYINGNTTGQRSQPNYRTYDASGWSEEGTMTSLGEEPRWIRVEASQAGTGSSAAFLYEDGGGRLKSSYWNGSDWSSYDDFQGIQLETSTQRDFDIAWSSQTNSVMVTYCKSNVKTHSYMLWTVGGSTTYGNMASGTGDGRWSVLKADPLTSDFLYMSIDDNNDVNIQRWDGASWVLLEEVEESSNLSYDSIGIAFLR